MILAKPPPKTLQRAALPSFPVYVGIDSSDDASCLSLSTNGNANRDHPRSGLSQKPVLIVTSSSTLTAALFAGSQETTLPLASLNFDFSCVKVGKFF